MKKIIGILIIILISFTLHGQDLNLKEKSYWETNNPKFKFEKPIIVDTIDHCKPISTSTKNYYLNNKDLCMVDNNNTKILSEQNWGNEVIIHNKPKPIHNYTYNFTGHISGSIGIKLADLSPSKIRLEWESDTKSENFTVGALISIYTLKYYYNGWRVEAFTRYYFVPNTSGEGAFLQFRLGTSKFQNQLTKQQFNSNGFGVDVGNKFIIVGNNNNFRNSFTLTPMGGIQVYNGPDGETPISWVWQLRFGYQF